MAKTFGPVFKINSPLREFALMIFLGLLSALLGMIKFEIPGIDSISSDLREIPLLIAVFYCRHLWGILIISVLTSISTPSEASIITYFTMHFIPLITLMYSKIHFDKIDDITEVHYAMIWIGSALVYYYILVVPISIILDKLQNPISDQPFFDVYFTIVPTLSFEVITTTLITSLYIIQHKVRDKLYYQNLNLEEIVTQRTIELSDANQELQTLNEELVASNEEVKTVNDNLEQLVLERTRKINQQLEKISKYAFINSHHLRAPVARILGLINLINHDDKITVKNELLIKLKESTDELDEIIKSMNRLLDEEIDDV
ncbi:hypothetical protein [Fulvivirga lutimaris]|uniref:hypothetical protein n=1 Tax=Fulvivirga lutimaris TaxID=1819566 RepID=UPI0012BCDF2A|nr:hypothetical protein [Fulvivirga lutimaris]MTI38814.1 hypothetical protein [Fulvivirga lutimaris]